MSRFAIGDRVRLWKPGHAEHGLIAEVGEVIPITDYGGPLDRGPHAYKPKRESGWHDPTSGEGWVITTLPDAMVVTEEDYQAHRATYSGGMFWRE